MKKLVILVVVGVGLFKAYGFYKVESLPPIYDHPYVVVYGRDSCGFTQRTRSALEEAGINFEYYSVDDKSVADTLHKRMEQSGIFQYGIIEIDLVNFLTLLSLVDVRTDIHKAIR